MDIHTHSVPLSRCMSLKCSKILWHKMRGIIYLIFFLKKRKDEKLKKNNFEYIK